MIIDGELRQCCTNDQTLQHHGTKGMKWGVKRYQTGNGTWTPEGLARRKARGEYGDGDSRKSGRVNNRQPNKSSGGRKTGEGYNSKIISIKQTKLKNELSNLKKKGASDERINKIQQKLDKVKIRDKKELISFRQKSLTKKVNKLKEKGASSKKIDKAIKKLNVIKTRDLQQERYRKSTSTGKKAAQMLLMGPMGASYYKRLRGAGYGRIGAAVATRAISRKGLLGIRKESLAAREVKARLLVNAKTKKNIKKSNKK